MQTLGVVTGVGIIGSGVTLMARILGNDGEPITQASLSSITYTVRDLTNSTTVVTSTALTISSVVFDSLQQDNPRWTQDNEDDLGPDEQYGYNFLATIPAASFANFDVDTDNDLVTPHKYQVDVKFTPASGQPFIQPFRFTTVPTWA